MPKIPMYERQVNLDVGGNKPVALSPEDTGISQLSSETFKMVQAAQEAMIEAKEFRQSTEAGNFALEKFNATKEAAFQDEDLDSTKHEESIDKAIIEASNTITGKQARDTFLGRMQRQGEAAKYSIRTLFRDRELQVGREAAVYQKEHLINSAGGKDEAGREADFLKFSQLLQDGVESGVIPKGLVDYEMADFKVKYVEAQAKYAIYTNPVIALEELKKEDGFYSELSLAKRTTLMVEAKKVMDKINKDDTIQTTQAQFISQSNFEERLDGMPLADALDWLDKGTFSGEYNEAWAKAKRKAILSVSGINQGKMNEFEYDVIMQIEDVTAGYKAKDKDQRKSKDAEEYLRQIHKIEIKINEGIAQGLISDKAAKVHLRKIYDSTTAEATQKAITGKPFIYDMKNADNFFKKVLDSGDRYSAIRQYFYDTDGKKLSNKDKEKIASDIAEKAITGNRDEVLEDNDLKIEGTLKSIDEQAKELGYEAKDVKETAKKYNISEQEVLTRLKK